MSTSTSKEQAVVAPSARDVSLWRNGDFLILLGGQVVSSLGSQMSQLAFPLLILAITGSPAKAGFVGALRAVPALLLSLPVGALVDRWDRKRVMIWSDAGRALALGSVPLALVTGHLTLVQLAAASLVEGTLSVTFGLADTAALPRVVSPSRVPQALSTWQVTESVAQVIGPLVGGALYGAGRSLPFLADALSYVASVGTILRIRTEFQGEREVASRSLRADVAEGMAWLWRHAPLRFLAVLTGGLMVCSVGYPLIMILLAQRLGASPFVIGVIFASAGPGSVVGALIAAPLQRRFGVGRVIVWATWVWALTWLFYLFAPTAFWLCVVNAAAFVVVPVYMITQSSYRLTAIPDRLQGRVNSVFRLIVSGSQPLGVAIAGLLLQAQGPKLTIIVLFVPQLALSVVATFYRPAWRVPTSEQPVIA